MSFILDTNMVRKYFYDQAKFEETFSSMGREVYITCITTGEIEFGMRRSERFNKERGIEVVRFVKKYFPKPLLVSQETGRFYGELKGQIFEKFAPQEIRRRSKYIEDLVVDDGVNQKSLGVQENDIWIAAIALERDMTLVTIDKMTRIRDVRGDLKIEVW